MHRSRCHPNINIARKTLAHAFVRSPCRILVVIVVLCFLALSILQQTNKKMDIKSTYFISHGSPTLAIDKELPARHFLEDWQKKFMPSKPRAILIVSAHWDTKYPAVNTPSKHSTIHDFYGFPSEMYQDKCFTHLSFVYLSYGRNWNMKNVLIFLQNMPNNQLCKRS